MLFFVLRADVLLALEVTGLEIERLVLLTTDLPTEAWYLTLQVNRIYICPQTGEVMGAEIRAAMVRLAEIMDRLGIMDRELGELMAELADMADEYPDYPVALLPMLTCDRGEEAVPA